MQQLAADNQAALDRLADEVLLASRALVAVAARSLARAESEVTITQLRALVLLSTRGPMTSSVLAELSATAPSSVTRLCDRLVAKGLIERAEDPDDRRNRTLRLLPAGEEVLARVTAARREEIRRIVAAIPEPKRRQVLSAMRTFSSAAGEVPGADWMSASVGVGVGS